MSALMHMLPMYAPDSSSSRKSSVTRRKTDVCPHAYAADICSPSFSVHNKGIGRRAIDENVVDLERWRNMGQNDQIAAREIMQQEKAARAPEMRDDEYFQLFSAQLLMKKYDLDDEEISAGLTDGGNDGGCDGIYLFINGELIQDDEIDTEKYKKQPDISLHIVQCKNTNGFSEDTIMKWKVISENLLSLESDYTAYRARYSGLVLEKMDMFRKTYLSLIRKHPQLSIQYHYVSFGSEIHPNLQAQAEELKGIVKEQFSGAAVVVDFITAEELVRLYNSHENSEHLLVCKEIMSASDDQEFITLTSLPEYYRFITDDEDNLIRYIFESNVRDYQGKITVNKQIAETLENGESQEDFWWLNNGVTILAKSVQQHGKRLTITEPEIVNGLQSTSEIYSYFKKDKTKLDTDNRKLLLRIIVPKTEETRDHIILATNSQTSIPKSSLRATDNLHRYIETFFKSKGLYYDRRKNYYKNQDKPLDKIISISFLSQCLISTLLAQPDYARARPSTLLENDLMYRKLFNQKTNLLCYYNAAYIGKLVADTIKQEKSFSATEKTNIQFATLFYYTATLVEGTQITARAIEGIELSKLNAEDIVACANKVKKVFNDQGGTDKVAKNADFTRALVTTFEKERLEQVAEQ